MALIPETTCWADTETGSECDLKTHGTHRYAEHPSTHIQLFSFAFNDGPVEMWDLARKQPMPRDLRDAFRDPKVVFNFWNKPFDSTLIRHKLNIILPNERYRCSMAAALSHGLPGSLEKCGDVLGIREDAKKIKDGKRLMMLFCKPKKHKNGTLTWNTPETHPEEWAAYVEYCRTDTAALREIAKKIPKWNYDGQQRELELWLLDQTVNERGFQVDLELANKAMDAIATAQKELAAQTKEMTNGEVAAASQRDAMLKFILEFYGIELPDMRKATLERIIEDEETPPPLRELIQVRLSTCTTSSSKYKKLVQATSGDGRLRGTIQFAGASRTLRDAGRIFQPQNLPSKGLMKDWDTLAGIEALKSGLAELLGFDIMKLTMSALRYAIVAPEGKKLVVADLSNIEGRGLSYLAGEEWKLQAFEDFDNGVGEDLYKVAYAKAFGIRPEDVTKEQRNMVGKILELSLGYGGGVGALLVFLISFGVDLEELTAQVTPNVPADVMAEAENFYDWRDGQDIAAAKNKAKKAKHPDLWQQYYEAKSTHYLEPHIHHTLESLKRLWRREHPATVKFWADADAAVRNAIAVPGAKFWFGKCYATSNKKWVKVILPSGHVICYPGMRINDEGNIVFRGVNQYSRKWCDIQTHGSKIVENCVQAFSRDIFKYGQVRAEKSGYEVILPVHDEIVSEVWDDGTRTLEGLKAIMSTVPPWAKGIPLSASGFEDYRYHK